MSDRRRQATQEFLTVAIDKPARIEYIMGSKERVDNDHADGQTSRSQAPGDAATGGRVAFSLFQSRLKGPRMDKLHRGLFLFYG